ncbi:hypothetical protein EON83_08035 [bacterium]|nr:MAG: hypothetical protein EON83_08035 [bacterium]
MLNVFILGTGTLFVAQRGGISYLKEQWRRSSSGIVGETYFKDRRAIFAAMPKRKTPIVFLGDSLTERCPWNELLQRNDVIVRGIGGEDIAGVIKSVPEVARHKPKRIFVMAGTNDIIQNKTEAEVVALYKRLISSLKHQSPQSVLVIQSILPMSTKVFSQYSPTEAQNELRATNQQIAQINKRIRGMANGKKIIYCDVAGAVKHGGQLDPKFTSDGIHLNIKGYMKWKKAITPLLGPTKM